MDSGIERLESMDASSLRTKEASVVEDIANLREEIQQREELLKFIEELIEKKRQEETPRSITPIVYE
jgi:hypothetical protein